MFDRLGYYLLILLTIPCLLLGVTLGLVEVFVREDAKIAQKIVAPFMWAVKRRRWA